MQIDSRTPSALSTDILASMGPEAMVQAAIQQLDADADHARADRHEATEARFDAAEAAIDHGRDAARSTMIAGIVNGFFALGQAVVGTALTCREGGSGSGSGSGTPEASGAAVVGSIAQLATPIAGMVGALLGGRTTDATNARDRAQLASERAHERADESGRIADREQSMHDQLARQLEEIVRQRHRVDDVALGGVR